MHRMQMRVSQLRDSEVFGISTLEQRILSFIDNMDLIAKITGAKFKFTYLFLYVSYCTLCTTYEHRSHIT